MGGKIGTIWDGRWEKIGQNTWYSGKWVQLLSQEDPRRFWNLSSLKRIKTIHIWLSLGYGQQSWSFQRARIEI